MLNIHVRRVNFTLNIDFALHAIVFVVRSMELQKTMVKRIDLTTTMWLMF